MDSFLSLVVFGVGRTLAAAALYGLIWVMIRDLTRERPRDARGAAAFNMLALGGALVGLMGSGVLSYMGFLETDWADEKWNEANPHAGFMLRHTIAGMAVAMYSFAHYRADPVAPRKDL
jgi:drug/metabolite transporter (DMT)-like permease